MGGRFRKATWNRCSVRHGVHSEIQERAAEWSSLVRTTLMHALPCASLFRSPQKEFLEPADSFDLGDDASSAEAAAGEWLGRKAAAKSRKKKSLKEKTARGSAATAATKEPAPAQNAPVAHDVAFPPSGAESGRADASSSPGADALSNSASDETCLSDAGSSPRNRPSRKGVSGKASLFGASQSHS